jgi:hypothetical protein
MQKVKVLLTNYDQKTLARVKAGLIGILDKIQYVEKSADADVIITCHIYVSDRTFNHEKKELYNKIEEKFVKKNK